MHTKKSLLEKKLIVYGAGQNGRKLTDCLLSRSYHVLCLMDRAADGTSTYHGLAIEKVSDKYVHEDHVVVLLAAFNREINILELSAHLKQLGYADLLNYYDVLRLFSEELGDLLWVSFSSEKSLDLQQIAATGLLFSEPLSRDIFTKTVQARQDHDIFKLPDPYPIKEQYFSRDIPPFPKL